MTADRRGRPLRRPRGPSALTELQASCRDLRCPLPGGRRGDAKADCQAIVGVHRGDRDRQVGELFRLEYGGRRFKVGIGHVRVSDLRHGLGPCERRALDLVENTLGFTPDADKEDLFKIHAVLEQVARMLADTIGAAVDLRDTEIDKLEQALRQSALQQVAVDAAEGPYPLW